MKKTSRIFLLVSRMLRRTQTWRLYTKLYNLGDTLLKNAQMKNSRGLILGEVVYTSITYHIPDS